MTKVRTKGLSEKAIKAIESDKSMIGILMAVEGKGEKTIKGWIDSNKPSSDLTKPIYTDVIAEHTKLSINQILS